MIITTINKEFMNIKILSNMNSRNMLSYTKNFNYGVKNYKNRPLIRFIHYKILNNQQRIFRILNK